MAKGQLRSNREAKKPKKEKVVKAEPALPARGPSTLMASTKKKD